MGKALTRRKGTRRQVRPARPLTLEIPGTSAFWRSASVIARRVALLAAVTAVTWGSLEVRRAVLDDPRFDLANWTLEFGEFPAWVTADIREEIESIRESALLAGGTADASVLAPGILARIREAILSNSWIEAVPELSIVYPRPGEHGDASGGGLVARLELRQPVVAVSWDGAIYLTDVDGRRLGRRRRMVPPSLRIPVIFGAPSFFRGEPPAAGDVWRVREIEEGIAVAREIYLAGLIAAVQEIDVRNVGGGSPLEPEILLYCDGYPPLAWGRSPISRGARLLPVKRKIENLALVLRQPPANLARFGRILLYSDRLVGDTMTGGAPGARAPGGVGGAGTLDPGVAQSQ